MKDKYPALNGLIEGITVLLEELELINIRPKQSKASLPDGWEAVDTDLSTCCYNCYRS